MSQIDYLKGKVQGWTEAVCQVRASMERRLEFGRDNAGDMDVEVGRLIDALVLKEGKSLDS